MKAREARRPLSPGFLSNQDQGKGVVEGPGNHFSSLCFILFLPKAASVPITTAVDPSQSVPGSGIDALAVPAFDAVKLETDPLVILTGGVTSENASDKPVMGPKVTPGILVVKVRLGNVELRDAEFPLPEKTASEKVAVR
jgi:hypothetical protein